MVKDAWDGGRSGVFEAAGNVDDHVFLRLVGVALIAAVHDRLRARLDVDGYLVDLAGSERAPVEWFESLRFLLGRDLRLVRRTTGGKRTRWPIDIGAR